MIRLRTTSGRLATAAFAVTALAGVEGCALAPKLGQAPETKPSQSYAASQTLAAARTEWPRADWWTAYRDDALTALIERGLRDSPTLAAAAARVRKAQAVLEQTRSSLWPSVALNAQAQDQQTSAKLFPRPVNPAQTVRQYDFDWTFRGTLDFTYELDFWGKNRNATAGAVSEAFAAEADRRFAVITLSTSIAGAYGELRRLTAARAVSADSVRVKKDTLALVQRRFDAGLDSQVELAQAQSGVAAALADLAASDESIALQRDVVALLIGAGPDETRGLTPAVEIAVPPFGLPANLPADLIGRRLDVVAARLRVESAMRRERAQKAAFYPDINLAASGGSQAALVERFFTGGSEIASFGPSLRLPIFEAGQLSGALRGARADYALAVANYDQALQQAIKDVADAVISIRALEERRAQTAAAFDAASCALAAARLRYEGGLSPFVNVLTAETAWLTNKRVLSDLDARGFALDVQLIKALGGGYEEDIRDGRAGMKRS